MHNQIVDINGLAKELSASKHTLKKNWRSWPHFFIGEGRNLKGARFIISEVVSHLKEEAGNVNLEKPKAEVLGSKISVPEPSIQKRRLSNPAKSSRMGDAKAQRAKKSSLAGDDPFNLLAGVNNVS